MAAHRLLVIRGMGGPGPALLGASLTALADLSFIYVPSGHDNPDFEVSEFAKHGDTTVLDSTQKVVETALEMARQRRFTGIVTYSDPLVRHAANIAAQLGLPGNPMKTADLLTRKDLQRQALADGNVPSAAFHVAHSVADIDDALAHVPFPMVVKPVSGSGGTLTFEVTNEADLHRELAAAFDAFDSAEVLHNTERAFVLEERLVGADWHDGDRRFGKYCSVESVVFQGQIHHWNVTDRTPLAPPFRETGLVIPSALTPARIAECEDVAQRAIVALGFLNGVTHIEMKLTATGARIIEVNGRPGGGLPVLWKLCSDVDGIKEHAKTALGIQPQTTVTFNSWACSIMPPAPQSDGEFVSVTGIQDALAVPGVVDFMASPVTGNWRMGIDSTMGRFTARADTLDGLLTTHAEVCRQIVYEYK